MKRSSSLLRSHIRAGLVAVVMSLFLAAMFSVLPTRSAAYRAPLLTDAPLNLTVTATSNASISPSPVGSRCESPTTARQIACWVGGLTENRSSSKVSGNPSLGG